MTYRTFLSLLSRLMLAGFVLFTGHYGFGWLAAAVLIALYLSIWVRRGRGASVAIELAPSVIIGLATTLIISLTVAPIGQAAFPAASQITLALLYAVWLAPPLRQTFIHRPLYESSIAQVLGISAIFLAAAFIDVPEAVTVVFSWLVAYVAALAFLTRLQERSAAILAATWALVVSQIAWVLLGWQVLYDIGSSGYLIVPQIAIIVIGLGYCYISIYATHREKRLSRRRLIEYMTVVGILMAIIIAGTKWDSTT